MPKRYKPQLDHIGFDWFYESSKILHHLLARKTVLLRKVGFYKEYGDPNDPRFTGHGEASALINEICGMLCVAAAIRMDAGFKARNQIIATLLAVEKNPSLVLTHTLEPEALGMLAQCYQRAEEPLGTFWFDIDWQANMPVPDMEQVRAAASKAIVLLKVEASPGRPPDKMIEYLAFNFRAIFSRFEPATRHSVAISADGKQAIAGPFVAFLEEVLSPLNRFFETLPEYYGAKSISAAGIAEYIRERQPPQNAPDKNCPVPHYPHKFRVESRGSFVFYRQVRNPDGSNGENTSDRNLHRRISSTAPTSD